MLENRIVRLFVRSHDHQPSPVFAYCQKQEEKKRKRTHLAGGQRLHTIKELAHARLVTATFVNLS